MPYIQFDLPRDPSDGDFECGRAKRVANLYAEVMQTTPSGVTVAVRELGARRVLRDGRPVVAIRCDIRSGRPDAQREAFAVALTDLVTEPRRGARRGAIGHLLHRRPRPRGSSRTARRTPTGHRLRQPS